MDNAALIHRLIGGLEEYGQIISVESNWNDPRLIIFSTEMFQGPRRQVGGYIDRLKGALSTTLLGILLERRVVIDWQTPSPIENALLPCKYDWRSGPERTFNAVSKTTVFDAINNEHFYRFSDQYLSDYNTTDLWKNQENPIKIHCNILFIDVLLDNEALLNKTRFGRTLLLLKRQNSKETIVNILLRMLFEFMFKYNPIGNYKILWQDFLLARQKGYIAGLHFRNGGDGKWLDPEIDSVNNVNIICSVLEKRIDASELSINQVFIASDSMIFREKSKTILREKFNCIMMDIPVTHFEKGSDADVIDQVQSTLLEHMCLMYCDLIVHGRGAFGNYAGRLAGVSTNTYF